jgi:sodium/hydrogen antiporter
MFGREFFGTYDLLLVAVGLGLLLTTIGAGWLKRLNLSSTFVYLLVGIAVGPWLLNMAPLDPLEATPVLERVAELAVIMSLIVLGIRIARPITWSRWRSTARLILIVMPLTIAGVALSGYWILGLALGPAVLLGAILAPTDPILAGPLEEQNLREEADDRFGLSSEAGLNDGLAFPFVYLGLHLSFAPLAYREWIGRWLLVDLLYAVLLALPLGWFIGKACGRLYLRQHDRDAVSNKRREFTPLALLLLAYGLVEALGAYGFLAAFTTGLGFRRSLGVGSDELARFANFTEAVDDLVKAVALIMVGALLRWSEFLSLGWELPAFALVLVLVLRPAVTMVATVGGRFEPVHRAYWAWFGIRGIGSVYYLCYALNRGLQGELATELFTIVLGTVLISIVLHGLTVPPFLRHFEGESDFEQ